MYFKSNRKISLNFSANMTRHSIQTKKQQIREEEMTEWGNQPQNRVQQIKLPPETPFEGKFSKFIFSTEIFQSLNIICAKKHQIKKLTLDWRQFR